MIKKYFIKGIYDENGILIGETYNWYIIGSTIIATCCIIGIGIYFYYTPTLPPAPPVPPSNVERVITLPPSNSHDISIWKVDPDLFVKWGVRPVPEDPAIHILNNWGILPEESEQIFGNGITYDVIHEAMNMRVGSSQFLFNMYMSKPLDILLKYNLHEYIYTYILSR